ncbi:unnamed protein product [Prorocentrum cordatum]|uniref:Alkaline phosphatase n=1 Tax=Prorocentrum cordatum TaxID=2364126 RepID=A0ABN9X9E5_9DINO|nr:unnamed protein product [Polarella glacialis]
MGLEGAAWHCSAPCAQAIAGSGLAQPSTCTCCSVQDLVEWLGDYAKDAPHGWGRTCKLGCVGRVDAQDSLEHYCRCQVFWQWALASWPRGLGVAPGLRSREAFVLLADGMSNQEIIRMSPGLYAIFRTVSGGGVQARGVQDAGSLLCQWRCRADESIVLLRRRLLSGTATTFSSLCASCSSSRGSGVLHFRRGPRATVSPPSSSSSFPPSPPPAWPSKPLRRNLVEARARFPLRAPACGGIVVSLALPEVVLSTGVVFLWYNRSHFRPAARLVRPLCLVFLPLYRLVPLVACRLLGSCSWRCRFWAFRLVPPRPPCSSLPVFVRRARPCSAERPVQPKCTQWPRHAHRFFRNIVAPPKGPLTYSYLFKVCRVVGRARVRACGL